jgi:hypothetical protein
MEAVLQLKGSKQELDRVCEHMGWETKPHSHHRFGWNGSTVCRDGEKIGFISTASREKPCILEITPRTADEAAQIVVATFTAGAIEKLKG